MFQKQEMPAGLFYYSHRCDCCGLLVDGIVMKEDEEKECLSSSFFKPVLCKYCELPSEQQYCFFCGAEAQVKVFVSYEQVFTCQRHAHQFPRKGMHKCDLLQNIALVGGTH